MGQDAGRPKKGEQPVVLGYRIQGRIIPQADQIAAMRLQKGRFILAINQLDARALSAEDMLKEYKNQHKTEASFRFIKGNAFEVSSVYPNPSGAEYELYAFLKRRGALLHHAKALLLLFFNR